MSTAVAVASRRPAPSRRRWVRCRGQRFQALAWLGQRDGWHLGYYPTQALAYRVAYAFRSRLRHGIDPCELLAELQRVGVVHRDVLPRFVRRRRAGGFYARSIARRGRPVSLRGPYTSAADACRAMYRRLRLTYPCFGECRSVPRVRLSRDELPYGVRQVRGEAYQARSWIPDGAGSGWSWNLGLFLTGDYDNDRDAAINAAARAAAAFKGLVLGHGMDPWAAISQLKKTYCFGVPLVRADVWPRWVRQLDDGQFIGRSRRGSDRIEVGPFDTPEEAHQAMRQKLTQMRKRLAATQ